MAFDGLVIRALAHELNEKLAGARLDKVHQPETDELLLSLHGPSGAFKLTLSANASIPRIALTEKTKENPMVAPMFCMLLRKHLASAHLISVRQPGLERMLSFDFETRNELGDQVTKTLIVEIMGRHSNIILVDENGRVADSIKRIDLSVSSKRQILPGLSYEMPPAQEKKDPLVCGIEGFMEVLATCNETERLDKAILNRFQGISPLVAREIVFCTFGETDKTCEEFDHKKRLDLATEMLKIFGPLSRGEFTPCYLTDVQTGKLMEFSAIPIKQYGNGAQVVFEESMGYLINHFYAERDLKERMSRRGADLLKAVATHTERAAKKLDNIMADLSETEKKDTFKQYGELITANLYRIEKGADSVRVENYYEEDMPTVTIPLDSTLSPAANAQRYFKKYNKAKTAALVLSEQLELTRQELSYLETVAEALDRAKTGADLAQIGEELAQEGYLRRQNSNGKKKDAPAMPLKLLTDDGFTLFAGKNNRQNDYLTCKMAHNKDLWFHTKNIPGSHVVLRFEQERPFTDAAITQVASLAAFMSKAREAHKVPVDYTEIKNVKKPAGAKPGFVIYTTNQTAYVTPKGIKMD